MIRSVTRRIDAKLDVAEGIADAGMNPAELFVYNAAAVSISRHIDIAREELRMAPASLWKAASVFALSQQSIIFFPGESYHLN